MRPAPIPLDRKTDAVPASASLLIEVSGFSPSFQSGPVTPGVTSSARSKRSVGPLHTSHSISFFSNQLAGFAQPIPRGPCLAHGQDDPEIDRTQNRVA